MQRFADINYYLVLLLPGRLLLVFDASLTIKLNGNKNVSNAYNYVHFSFPNIRFYN